MASPKEVLNRLKPVLDEYLEEKAAIEKQIAQQGTIPRYFCERCHHLSILEVQKLSEEQKRGVGDLVGWMEHNDIRYFRSDGKSIRFSSSMEKVEGIKGSTLILVTPATEPSQYDYAIPISKLQKKTFFPILNNEFHRMGACGHLDRASLKSGLPVLLLTTSRYLSTPLSVDEILKKPKETTLRLLCSECFERIESVGCEEGITRRTSFAFTYLCPVKHMLLQTLLRKHMISFAAPSLEHWYKSTTIYLDELQVLVTDEKKIESEVEKLKPKCILAFGTQKDLFSHIRLGADVIIFDDSVEATQRYFVFDKDKKVDDSPEHIVKAVVDKLDTYAEEIRGKEHDRLVEAFQRIGRDLGFVAQQELGVKGTRVDAAWLDRQGVVQVAIEVETSSAWKKDLVSTWETQPKLAIILIHDKTDRGIKDVIQYGLVRTMPHGLLFINYALKRAYLIDNQEILRCYDLEKKTEMAKTEVIEF